MDGEKEDTGRATNTQTSMFLSCICEISTRTASDDKDMTVFTQGDEFS